MRPNYRKDLLLSRVVWYKIVHCDGLGLHELEIVADQYL